MAKTLTQLKLQILEIQMYLSDNRYLPLCAHNIQVAKSKLEVLYTELATLETK